MLKERAHTCREVITEIKKFVHDIFYGMLFVEKYSIAAKSIVKFNGFSHIGKENFNIESH